MKTQAALGIGHSSALAVRQDVACKRMQRV